MGTRTTEVLIDIEDQKGQLYHRLKVNGMTVLVDGTPEDDPAIGQTIDWILAAPEAYEVCRLLAQRENDDPLVADARAVLARVSA